MIRKLFHKKIYIIEYKSERFPEGREVAVLARDKTEAGLKFLNAHNLILEDIEVLDNREVDRL